MLTNCRSEISYLYIFDGLHLLHPMQLLQSKSIKRTIRADSTTHAHLTTIESAASLIRLKIIVVLLQKKETDGSAAGDDVSLQSTPNVDQFELEDTKQPLFSTFDLHNDKSLDGDIIFV